MTVFASVRASPAGERAARNALIWSIAEQVLGAAEPDGAGIVAKQRIERIDIVRHQRALVAVECAPYLGDDIR